MRVEVPIEPLTPEAFAPYGSVVRAPARPGRSPVPSPFDCAGDKAVAISTTHAAGDPRRLDVDRLERHPHSAQAFLPLDAARWIVAVASIPDAAALRAFEPAPSWGVVIGRGVWHHGLTVLDGPGRFAVVMGRGGATPDDDWADIAPCRLVPDEPTPRTVDP